MKPSFYHVHLNVTDLDFYRDLFGYFDFTTIKNYARGFGVSDGQMAVWVFKTRAKYGGVKFHRQQTGINHLAIRVDSKDAIDRFYNEFVKKRGLTVLYGGPKEYPQYVKGYYGLYFEDPDRLKLEIVYRP